MFKKIFGFMFLIMLPFISMAEGTKDMKNNLETATFAGGCFWCMEPPFKNLEGVVSVVSGYTGGTKANPTYEEVSTGKTGHAESVEIIFDPKKVSYQTLLEIFWKNIDPTNASGQFCDIGSQYRTAIFYHGEEQHKAAAASKKALEDSKKFKEVFTEITEATKFYPAEDYHQNFYLDNPGRYKAYRLGCGRDEKLDKLWNKK